MASSSSHKKTFHVIVVGCGLGGLSCAIGCRREGLQVTILEQAAGLAEIGAGIQLPPNAARTMAQYDLLEKLVGDGQAVAAEHNEFSDYRNGDVISARPGSEWAKQLFGYAWYVIHRADYRRILAEEATRLGAKLRFDCHVASVDCHSASVELMNGTVIVGDVVIGADGLNSIVRDAVLEKQLEPTETGDLAYRATITRDHIKSLNNKALNDMLKPGLHKVWWGPDSHAVLYSVRGGDVWNLVFAVPDDLPPRVSKVPGNIEQMRALFEGWDPRLQSLIAEIPSSLKWKLVTLDPLDTWVQDLAALLGDACHPTLPYQAQGAAMAVEDGACLAKILGLSSRADVGIPDALKLYERLRKQRTELNVQGANSNRAVFHAQGEAAEERNEVFKNSDWYDPDAESPYKGFSDMPYLRAMLGFDTVTNAERSFHEMFGDSSTKVNGNSH